MKMNNQTRLAAFHRIVIFAWVFVLVLALFPLTANPVKPIKELASSVFVLVLAISLLAMPAKPGVPYDWGRMPVMLLAGLWLLWGFVCALLSDFKMAGMDELRVYLTWYLMALFAARVFREPRQVHQLFLVICLAVFLSSVYGFAQYLGYDIFPWSTRDVEEYRGLPSTYANPNFAGHTLMLSLILGACLMTIKKMRWIIPLLILIAAHLYLTHMRGAPVALLAGALLTGCALVVSRVSRAGAGIKPIVTLSAVAILGLAGVTALLPVSKLRTGFYVPTDGSLILRYNGYYGAAKMALDHPLTGMGPGNYGREAIAYWTPYEKRWFADQQKRNLRTHCDLLETATESGLPGLALHVALLMALLVRSLALAFTGATREKRHLGYAFAAFFLAFTVDGLFGFNLRVPVSGGLFFLMMGTFEGLTAPMVLPDLTLENTKKKQKASRHIPAAPEKQPRVFSSLALCGAALLCLIGAGVVFAGEIYYQKGNGAKVFVDNPDNSLYYPQALKQGEEALLTGRSLVFWDERYSDLLGHLAMKAGNTEAAIDYYRQALQTDTHHPHKAANLARAYLSHALRFARDNVVPDYTQVAGLLEEAHRQAELAARYCDISPYVQDVSWRIARAQAVLAEEQGRDAKAYWAETADKIQASRDNGPRDVAGSFKGLGMAYMKTGQPEKALEPLVNVLEEDLTDEPSWALLETAARDSGNTEPLLNVLYKNYAQASADLPETEEGLVTVLRRIVHSHAEFMKETRIATRFVRDGLALVPRRAEPWALYSGLAAQQGNTTLPCRAAEQVAESANAKDVIPAFMRAMCSRAEIGDAVGLASQEIAREAMKNAGQPSAADFAGAADLLMLMLEGQTLPGTSEAEIKANIATAYLEAGRWEQADRFFAYAIERLPDNTKGRLLSARARALAGMRKNEDAMDIIRQGVRYAPEDPLVQLTYARLLSGSGRIEEAVFAYTAAMNGLPDASPLKAQAKRELERLRAQTGAPVRE